MNEQGAPRHIVTLLGREIDARHIKGLDENVLDSILYLLGMRDRDVALLSGIQ